MLYLFMSVQPSSKCTFGGGGGGGGGGGVCVCVCVCMCLCVWSSIVCKRDCQSGGGGKAAKCIR